MFINAFFLCCFLQPLFHYFFVFGKRESLQRFVVEEGAKPAIFGSYSYDPVKQVFIPPPPDPEEKDTEKDRDNEKDTGSEKDKDSEKHRDSEKYKDSEKDKENHDQLHNEELDKDEDSGPNLNTSPHITTKSYEDSEPHVHNDVIVSTAGVPVNRAAAKRTSESDVFFRKHVEPLTITPWWAQAKTTFKNVTSRLRLM